MPSAANAHAETRCGDVRVPSRTLRVLASAGMRCSCRKRGTASASSQCRCRTTGLWVPAVPASTAPVRRGLNACRNCIACTADSRRWRSASGCELVSNRRCCSRRAASTCACRGHADSSWMPRRAAALRRACSRSWMPLSRIRRAASCAMRWHSRSPRCGFWRGIGAGCRVAGWWAAAGTGRIVAADPGSFAQKMSNAASSACVSFWSKSNSCRRSRSSTLIHSVAPLTVASTMPEGGSLRAMGASFSATRM